MSEDKQQKEYQKILDALLQEPCNKFCADCGASRPTWASAKIGVFICMKCAGIHRGLGTHISFVRSVQLDKWKEHEIETILAVGNSRAAQIYEGNLPANYPRPSAMDPVGLEKFIRSKYQFKKFYNENGNANMPRRQSTERRNIVDTKDEHGATSPRKVIRKPPPHGSTPTHVKPPEHTPTPNTIPIPTPTPLSQPTAPNSTLLYAGQAKTIDLFGPTPTTPTKPLFGELEVSAQTAPPPTDTKAIKNEIKGLFEIATPAPYTTTPQGANTLGLLFAQPQTTPQYGQTQFAQYPVQYAQPQFYAQPTFPQQQVYYQTTPLSYQQPQLYQQQSQLQQQDAFDLLNKIQSKSTATSTPLF